MRPKRLAVAIALTMLGCLLPAVAKGQTLSPAVEPTGQPETGIVTFESADASQRISITPLHVAPATTLPPDGLVCHTPCTLRLPVGAYEVNATTSPDGTGPHVTRMITVDPGASTVRVTPAHSRALAIGLTVAGSAMAAVGLVSLVIGLDFALTGSNAGSYNATAYDVVGVTGLVVGFAAMIPGLVLLSRTRGGIDERRAGRRRVEWIGLGAAPMSGGFTLGTAVRF